MFFLVLFLASTVSLAWFLAWPIAATVLTVVAIGALDLFLTVIEGDSAIKRFVRRWRWVPAGVGLYMITQVMIGVPPGWDQAGILHITLLGLGLGAGYKLLPPEGTAKGRQLLAIVTIAVAGVAFYQHEKWDITTWPGFNWAAASLERFGTASNFAAANTNIGKQWAVISEDDVATYSVAGEGVERAFKKLELDPPLRKNEVILCLSDTMEEANGIPLVRFRRAGANKDFIVGEEGYVPLAKITWRSTRPAIAKDGTLVDTPSLTQAKASDGSTAATRTPPREKIVQIQGNEPCNTGLVVAVGDVIQYLKPTAPFKISGGVEGMTTVTGDWRQVITVPGSIILHPSGKSGEVRVVIN